MKLNLAHNWIAKILSLLLATAIWFLIKDHLKMQEAGDPPRARIVPEDWDKEPARRVPAP